MIERLALKDKEWRKMAYHICKDRYLADDLTQEMYLKLATSTKEINDYYIFFTIRNIFIDTVRRLKKQTNYIENIEVEYEEYNYEQDMLKEYALEQVDQLPFYPRTLLIETQVISQRKLSRETGIEFQSINQTIKKARKELCQKVTEFQLSGQKKHQQKGSAM